MQKQKSLYWINIQDIVFLLLEQHPNINPLSLRFTQLHQMVMSLPNFADDPQHANEKILESIQMLWLDEK